MAEDIAGQVKAVRAERRSKYGEYHENADVTWELMQVFMKQPQWWSLTPAVQHGIYMNQHKLARAICGDPDYEDNWIDIAGYAECVLWDIRRRNSLPNLPIKGGGTPIAGGGAEAVAEALEGSETRVGQAIGAGLPPANWNLGLTDDGPSYDRATE